MTRIRFVAALMSAAAAVLPAAAWAQPASPDTAATTNDTPPEGDPAGVVTPPPAPPTPEDAASRTEFLAAQVDALQQQIDALKAQMTQVQPSWKGAPQWSGDNGFTFKPKGFAQFDAGYVDNPNGAISGPNLGWNTRLRRAVIGAEGTLPGGFGYKAEFDFAQGSVGYEDIVLTYKMKSAPLQITVGNFYPLSSLDTLTSSRLTSFLERASFTDAFAYNRRLGVAIGLADEADTYSLTAGVWSQEINNANFARTGWQASARGTYSPRLGSGRLHLGVNYQHRVNQRDNQNFRYRSRPFTQITDQRFADTGAIASTGDDVLGVELGAIFGPFHFASEAQQLWVDGYRPGAALDGKSAFSNDPLVLPNFYADDPTFRTAYAEIGYYLTGESRGYKGGKWDRTKVLKPFDQGGFGAIQVNARLDWLDLKDRVGDGGLSGAPDYVNGGRQLGYQLSVIWNPIDYIRFMAQYAHASIEGGPRAAAVKPGSAEPVFDRGYGVDSFAVRAQVEF